MARTYSQNLRDRVIDAVESEGLSRRAAARRFGVSAAAAIKWLQRFHHATEHTVEATWRRIGTLLDCFGPAECHHYFTHAGYAST